MEDKICPYCGHIMLSGYIMSARYRLFWSPAKMPKSIFSFKTRKEQIHVGKFNGWYGGYIDSYRCPHCKTIIIQE